MATLNTIRFCKGAEEAAEANNYLRSLLLVA